MVECRIYLCNLRQPLSEPSSCGSQKGGFTVIRNEKNELIPTRTVIGWRVCIDYRKLNTITRKDHYPLPFINQMLDRLAGHPYLCFLDGYLGYNQIALAPEDQEKTTFTCPMAPLLLEGCHLDYVMVLPLFKGV